MLDVMPEWIFFRLKKKGEKTDVYEVLTRDEKLKLGEVKWFGRWRKYSFFPEPETVFETACLGDIQNFLFELMEKRRLGKNR